tara:strand:- start:1607 stop:1783 length:177 start_codon:yes stop_codon:yes gene_type:complete
MIKDKRTYCPDCKRIFYRCCCPIEKLKEKEFEEREDKEPEHYTGDIKGLFILEEIHGD